LGKTWPALDVTGDHDLILAAADDYSPTAVEERDTTLRIFFATSNIRDRAASALTSRFPVSPLDVDDEDWARRAQPMAAITVGRITVVPAVPAHPAHPAHPADPAPSIIVIPPSMGFGTGHHATTRLCLAALQSIDLRGKFVLDVGTGSGLLAIAAAKLGAARALGLDDDADAIQAAKENLGLNNVTNVEFVVSDVMKDTLPRADVVLANLTGALLVRAASRLIQAMLPGGVLIISGILAAERDEVRRAFANPRIVANVQEERDDAEWLAFTLKSV
jgi:ribosomal protein L11 methyltransferase